MKLWVENISFPNVQYTDEDLSATHTDYSNDIEKWKQYGYEVLQWMHVRRKIQSLVVGIVNPDYSNWGGLTQAQKDIAINLILAPYALRVPAVTDEEDSENWVNLVKNTRGISGKCAGGRAYVIELMRERVSDNLRVELWSHTTADAFYYDTSTHITAYEFANTPDLIQWLTNAAGSPYENDGFAQKSYYSDGLKDDLVNIYYGFY